MEIVFFQIASLKRIYVQNIVLDTRVAHHIVMNYL